MPKGPSEERVAVFNALLDPVFARISKESPTTASGVSPLEGALAPRRDEIVAALDRGYAAGTIARLLKEADELDATYSQEAIRLAILKVAGLRPAAQKNRRGAATNVKTRAERSERREHARYRQVLASSNSGESRPAAVLGETADHGNDSQVADEVRSIERSKRGKSLREALAQPEHLGLA